MASINKTLKFKDYVTLTSFRRSRRGFAYTAFMVVITLVLLISMVTVVLIKENKFNFKRIGDIQLNALETYQNSEKTLFMIDKAAKYSMYSSIHELAENGGLYSVSSGCGDYLEYPIWYSVDKECYPGNIQDEFILTYNKNLNDLASGIITPESFVYAISKNNPLKIIGVSREVLEFPISYTTENHIEKKETCPVPELQDMDAIGIECLATQSHCALRPEVIEKLKKAMDIAADKGFELVVTSGYRTYEQQLALKAAKGEQAAKASCNAPHVTGGAVDVVLKGEPYMTSKGYPVGDMSLGNRQVLEDIMCEAGFVRYPGEFWHYEYGTKRWKKGKEAGVCAFA